MDFYLHVRVLFGMIVGLSVAHLLKGVALIVQHPKRYRVYWVHLVWILFLFLYLIHFWWWEFNLVRVREWTFPIYFFVAVYAVLLYLLCTLFFPTRSENTTASRVITIRAINGFLRSWGSYLSPTSATDSSRVRDYLIRLGPAYAIHTATYLVLGLLAIRIKRPWFHATFAVFAVIYEIAYILELYWTVG